MCGEAEYIRVTDVDGVAVVCFNNLQCALSSLDQGGIGGIGEELDAFVNQRQWVSIILDFEGEEFIPWASFDRIMVMLHKRLEGNLKLCNVPPMAMECLQINRLTTVFDIYPSREDALKSTA